MNGIKYKTPFSNIFPKTKYKYWSLQMTVNLFLRNIWRQNWRKLTQRTRYASDFNVSFKCTLTITNNNQNHQCLLPSRMRKSFSFTHNSRDLLRDSSYILCSPSWIHAEANEIAAKSEICGANLCLALNKTTDAEVLLEHAIMNCVCLVPFTVSIPRQVLDSFECRSWKNLFAFIN